jgi:hypothetical protein
VEIAPRASTATQRTDRNRFQAVIDSVLSIVRVESALILLTIHA